MKRPKGFGVSRVTPRILFLISDNKFFQSHRLALAKAALSDGFIVAVAGPPYREKYVYQRLGIKYLEVPFRRARLSLNNELRTFAGILLALKSFRPHVVHSITAKPIFYGGLLCRLQGIPAVSAITGLGYVFIAQGWSGSLLRHFALACYKLAVDSSNNIVVFQNRDDLQVFQSGGVLHRCNWTLIGGSGVDLTTITPHPLPEGVPVVLLASRMLRDKGVADFVEAARILRSAGISARFRLLGDPDPGNPTSIPPAELEHWHREGIVEWRPHTSAINEELAKSNIVVLPSYREGFPKSLIDAAAAGRASAASDVPGCRDAIVPGVTGLLFQPRRPSHMAEVLAPLIQSRTRQTIMGAAARQHAERRFDIRETIRTHLDIYRQLAPATPQH